MKNAPLLVIAAAGLAAGCVMGPEDYPRRSVNELTRYGPPAEPIPTAVPKATQRRALNSEQPKPPGELDGPAALDEPAPVAAGPEPGAGLKQDRPASQQQTKAPATAPVEPPTSESEPSIEVERVINEETPESPASDEAAADSGGDQPPAAEPPGEALAAASKPGKGETDPPAPLQSGGDEPEPTRAALLVEQPSAPRETNAPAEPDYTGPLFDVVAIRQDAAAADETNAALDEAGVSDRYTMDKGDRFLIYLGRYKSEGIAARRAGDIKDRAGIEPEIRQVR